MSYTPPAGDAAELKLGTGYSAPAGGAANLEFAQGSIASAVGTSSASATSQTLNAHGAGSSAGTSTGNAVGVEHWLGSVFAEVCAASVTGVSEVVPSSIGLAGGSATAAATAAYVVQCDGASTSTSTASSVGVVVLPAVASAAGQASFAVVPVAASQSFTATVSYTDPISTDGTPDGTYIPFGSFLDGSTGLPMTYSSHRAVVTGGICYPTPTTTDAILNTKEGTYFTPEIPFVGKKLRITATVNGMAATAADNNLYQWLAFEMYFTTSASWSEYYYVEAAASVVRQSTDPNFGKIDFWAAGGNQSNSYDYLGDVFSSANNYPAWTSADEHTFAAVYDGTIVQMYVDNVLIGDFTIPSQYRFTALNAFGFQFKKLGLKSYSVEVGDFVNVAGVPYGAASLSSAYFSTNYVPRAYALGSAGNVVECVGAVASASAAAANGGVLADGAGISSATSTSTSVSTTALVQAGAGISLAAASPAAVASSISAATASSVSTATAASVIGNIRQGVATTQGKVASVVKGAYIVETTGQVAGTSSGNGKNVNIASDYDDYLFVVSKPQELVCLIP